MLAKLKQLFRRKHKREIIHTCKSMECYFYSCCQRTFESDTLCVPIFYDTAEWKKLQKDQNS